MTHLTDDNSFHVGDRVTCLAIGGNRLGTIVCVDGNGMYGVRFDDCVPRFFHDLDGRCEDGHGWWSHATNLRHAA